MKLCLSCVYSLNCAPTHAEVSGVQQLLPCVPDGLVDERLAETVNKIFDNNWEVYHGKQIPLQRFKQELKQRLGFEKDPTYTIPRMFMPKILTGEIEEIRVQFKSDIYLVRDKLIYQPKKSAQH